MSNLVFRSVQNDDEMFLAHDLMAKMHCKDYWEGMQWMQNVGRHYPGFIREHTRVALLDGEIACALRMTPDTLRIGEARLKMGGFGWVSTAGHCRNKGIARQLMANTMDYLKRHNYHVSMLFGIPNFYHRFGFVTTLADYRTTMNTVDLAPLNDLAFRVRDGKPGDIQAIQKMHEASDQHTSCSIIRCAAHISHQWSLWKGIRIVTNENGTPLAYFLTKDEGTRLTVREVGFHRRETSAILLEAIRRDAERHFLNEVAIDAPPSHAFIQYLMRYKSRHEMRLTQNEGGMLALVNLPETLESMIPEWEQGLRQAGLAGERIEATLVVERKPHRIRAVKGSIDIAQHNGANKFGVSSGDFIALMSGYRYFNEVFAQQRRLIAADGRALLAAMFPRRTPFVWPTDRF